MLILVIGSEGNIGNPLVSHLRKNNYDVLEVDIHNGYRKDYLVADINHPIDLFPAFDKKPDVVFLLSAMVSRVVCEQASSLSVATNLVGVNNVIQLCKRTKSKLIFFSTSEVYGPYCNIMDETETNLQPNNRYGLTKLLGEKIVEYEAINYGLNAIILRPFMIYDEYDEYEDQGDHRSAMIRFVTSLAAGKIIEVHKGCERSWMHISDAVCAIERAVYVDKYMVINIGNDNVITVEDLSKLICKRLDASESLIKLIEQPDRMTKTKRPRLDRQKQILGVIPKIDIVDGIDRVCQVVQKEVKNNG
jgi:nucleoside-diphosphate-sugar epimerase